MKIKFCPKCESKNVELKMTALTAKGKPAEWHCKNCFFHNIVFPEKEAESENEHKE